MKTLIIPDIHGRTYVAEAIITKVNADNVLFLGDYFDFYGDNAEFAQNIAIWLKESMKNSNRIHLLGNHDLSYMSNNQNIKCSGYNGWKHFAINKVNIKWDNLKLFHWVDDWLCTHAGLTRNLIPGINAKSVNEVLELALDDLTDLENLNKNRPFLDAGYGRGGQIGTVGGLVWCDYDEFMDIPNIKQIFGHTRHNEVRHVKNEDGSEHYCLDTGLTNFAVYDSTKKSMRVYKTDD